MNASLSTPQAQEEAKNYFIYNFAILNMGEFAEGLQNILMQAGNNNASAPDVFINKVKNYDPELQSAMKAYIAQNLQAKEVHQIIIGLQSIVDSYKKE